MPANIKRTYYEYEFIGHLWGALRGAAAAAAKKKLISKRLHHLFFSVILDTQQLYKTTVVCWLPSQHPSLPIPPITYKQVNSFGFIKINILYSFNGNIIKQGLWSPDNIDRGPSTKSIPGLRNGGAVPPPTIIIGYLCRDGKRRSRPFKRNIRVHGYWSVPGELSGTEMVLLI